MDISKITSGISYDYQTTQSKANTEEKEETTESSGVVYEKSNADYKTQNAELIQRLKLETEERTNQLTTLVQQMISKQGNAYGAANDIWSFLASGDYTVSPEVKAQAQKDIAEDGYWGVKQTSERILDFAKALSGGDPAQAEKMRSAFEKGYEQATKAWGKDLPSISKDTYDAVMKGFDEWAAELEE